MCFAYRKVEDGGRRSIEQHYTNVKQVDGDSSYQAELTLTVRFLF